MSDQKLYKMRTVTSATGFSPAVLRAWERRHGLLHPRRGPGGHRLFTKDDLTLLKLVRRRMREGRSIGELALTGRDELLAEARALTPVGTPPAPTSEGPTTMAALQARTIDAALALNGPGIEQALDEAFALVAPTQVIAQLIEPVTRKIGDHWAQGTCGVAHEHLLSGVFKHRLRKLVETASQRSTSRPPVLFACLPDEQHDLGLLTLAYRCAQHGVQPCYLGPSLPFEDLETACNQVQPSAVVLSVTRRALYDSHRSHLIDFTRRQGTGTRILIGGQGTPLEDTGLTNQGGLLLGGELSIENLLSELVG